MAFIPVPETATFALRGTLHGQQVVNTLSFQKGGGWNTLNLGNFAEAIQVWWSLSLAPQLSGSLVMDSVYALSLASVTAPSLVVDWVSTPNTGQQVGEALPGNVAFCVSFRTGARGRSGRGRNYVPGLRETDVTGNTVAAGRVTGLTNAYSNLFNLATENAVTWVVCQKYSNKAPLIAGIPRPVLFVTTSDARVDSQRGRLG